MPDHDVLDRAPIWGAIRELSELKDFQELASCIRFREEVNDAVVGRFELVKKLLVHSYFEYGFLELAFERALMTFEMALRKRYREIKGHNPDRKAPSEPWRFEKLIDWAAPEDGRRFLFDEDQAVIHSLRKMRNRVAHPEGDPRHGMAAFDAIFHIVDLINGLYDDVGRRRERHCETQEVNAKLAELRENGAILEGPKKKLIIFEAHLLHLDNDSDDPAVYYFLFWPIFNPTRDAEGSIDIKAPIVLRCSAWDWDGNVFQIKSLSGPAYTVSCIFKPENANRFATWRVDFEEEKHHLRAIMGYEIGKLKVAVRRGELRTAIR